MSDDDLVLAVLPDVRPCSAEVIALAAGRSVSRTKAALARLRKAGKAHYQRSKWVWSARSNTPSGWTRAGNP